MTDAIVTPITPTTLPPNAAALLAAGLKLPREERARLAEELLVSLDESDPAEIALAWRQECERRHREIKDGAAVLYDGAEVLQEARRLVGL